ncbi:MAG: Fe-S cluster assembly protein SufD, partial [Acetobacter persici]
MNAITQDRSDTLAPFGTRLDGVTDPVRKAATGALHRSGLPDRRVEEWRYTSLRFLAETPLAAPADVYDVAQIQAQLEELGLTDGPLADLPRLVFVNGRYAEAFSVLPAEVDVSFFAKTQTFGPLSCPDRDPLAALNTALAADGAQVRVPAGKKGGDVLLVSLGQTDASVSF